MSHDRSPTSSDRGLNTLVHGSHPDDAAVDRFAAEMKAKLRQKRLEGRGGWEDESECPPGSLQAMLRKHLDKGDPVDIGNFAMMLWNRGESACYDPFSSTADTG